MTVQPPSAAQHAPVLAFPLIVNTSVPVPDAPEPSELVTVMLRGPGAAPGAMTKDKPVIFVPRALGVGVPVTLTPDPETAT